MKSATAKDRTEGRLLILRLAIAAVVLVLAGRLWQVQMAQGDNYRVLADRNRFRQVDVAAPRGVIYDRNGVILARNRPSFTVALVPADLPGDSDDSQEGAAEAAVLDRLLAILARPEPTPPPSPAAASRQSGVKPAVSPTQTPATTAARSSALEIPKRQPWVMARSDIEQKLSDGRLGGAYRPVPIARYINETTAFLIAEDAINLPGVQLQLEPIRDYPSGALTAHLLG